MAQETMRVQRGDTPPVDTRPEQRLEKQAAIARGIRARSQRAQQDDEAERQQFSGEILDYDAPQGAWVVRLEDGSTILALSLSSGSGKGKGEIVSVYVPAQGMAVLRSL